MGKSNTEQLVLLWPSGSRLLVSSQTVPLYQRLGTSGGNDIPPKVSFHSEHSSLLSDEQLGGHLVHKD